MTPYDAWKTSSPDDNEIPDEFVEEAIKQLNDQIMERAQQLYDEAIQQGEQDRAEAMHDAREARYG